jgi:VWFA-related protein
LIGQISSPLFLAFDSPNSGGPAALPSRGIAGRVVFRHAFVVAGAWLICGLLASSPAGAAQINAAASPNSTEKQPEFRLHVGSNLVVVRVVVRDSEGRPMEKLHKEDFRLFDNGKQQAISQFEVENPPPQPASVKSSAPQPEISVTEEPAAPVAKPRFLALYFDDFDMSVPDVTYARDAADRYLAANLRPTDRAAIVTASGSNLVDFTSDLKQLHTALMKLQPSSRGRSHDCPDITDYQAEQIIDHEQGYVPGPPGAGGTTPVSMDATTLAIAEAIGRCRMPSMSAEDLVPVIRSLARAKLDRSRMEARFSLETLSQLVNYMANVPGQRSIVLISTGFLSSNQQFLVNAIIDRALHSRIIINSVDPKGLTVQLREADASSGYIPTQGDLVMTQHRLDSERETEAAAVLQEVAEDTGGRYFHNSNDLDAGFREAATGFEPGYILAFSPKHMNFDGKFHTLKVTLAVKTKGITLQARRGYFAPKQAPDLEAEAQQEIKQVLRSRLELDQLPVTVKTKTSKAAGDTELYVWAHLDITALHFRRENERNCNALTFVSAVFGHDGQFVTGQEKHLDLALPDPELKQLLASGIDVTLTFNLKPGDYIVREVVTDSEEHRLAALSRNVDVP